MCKVSNMVLNEKSVVATVWCITYNHERYIRQCLEGIVSQKTNFCFEAIVHDDASTDGTVEIIKEYAANYPDIIKPIYETENQYSKRDGSLTRIMEAHTRGSYIAFCEGDDYWIDPLKLQKQVDILSKHKDVSLVFSNRIVIREGSSLKHYSSYPCKYFDSKDLLGGMILGLQTVCCRKQFINNPTNLNGDIVIPYNASLHGRLFCISDVTAVYRITGAGVASSRGAEEGFHISLRHMWDFHKAYGFPSESLLIKAQARYVFGNILYRILHGNFRIDVPERIMLSYYQGSIFKRFKVVFQLNCHLLVFFVNSLIGRNYE